MSFKLGRQYEASILLEGIISFPGREMYKVIYGKHINGYFCCIPDHGIGCEMTRPTGTAHNAQSLVACGLDEDAAKNISEAIQQTAVELSENMEVTPNLNMQMM